MPTVSNTSPIFNLACIDRLSLLHDQFGTLWIPEAVEADWTRTTSSSMKETDERGLVNWGCV